MALFFWSRQRTPAELVRLSRDTAHKLINEADPKSVAKNSEELSKHLATLKGILYGDGGNEPSPELIAQLAQEAYNTDLLPLLIRALGSLEFEAKKDTGQIFISLLHRLIGTRHPTVEYLGTRESVLHLLVKGYEDSNNALHTGPILRECLRHESLARLVLYHEQSFFALFTYVTNEDFAMSADAFQTFKHLLTQHQPMVAEFLDARYDDFFRPFTDLLNSPNYVTKRQSLKLLGELLLERVNFNIMTRYISHSNNLKLIMVLLRDRSRNVQYEAFHVFKVFVANPNKAPEILGLLTKNRRQILTFLSTFQEERTRNDNQFAEEKNFLIRQIEKLPVDE